MSYGEVLAPAGEPEAVEKLILAGADAIYVGLSGFSSRPQSADFTTDEIEAALETCHHEHVRLHVALNGCVSENMIGELEKQIIKLDRMGVDALILADWGMLAFALHAVKHAEIHASTLLGCMNSASVRLLQKMGVKRVVLSTNLYMDEIAGMIASVPGMEYEIVAEGGICFNDNRICELPHTMEGGQYQVYCKKKYDFYMDGEKREANPIWAKHITCCETAAMYLEMGVFSYKIEGRTACYQDILPRVTKLREALDRAGRSITEQRSSLHYIGRMRNVQREAPES